MSANLKFATKLKRKSRLNADQVHYVPRSLKRLLHDYFTLKRADSKVPI